MSSPQPVAGGISLEVISYKRSKTWDLAKSNGQCYNLCEDASALQSESFVRPAVAGGTLRPDL
jgi:hypothetical protein